MKGKGSLGTERKILGATGKGKVTGGVPQCAHYILDVGTDHLG